MVMGRRRGRPRKDANKSAVKEIEIERLKKAYVKRKNIPPPTPADDDDTITFEDTPFQKNVKKVKTKIGERRKLRTKRRDEDEEYVVKVKRVYVKNKRTKAPAPTKDDDDDTIKNEDIDLGRVSIKVEVTGELDFSSIGAQLDLAPGPELKAVIKSETIVGDGSLLSTMKRKYTKRTEEEKKKKKSEWSCKICNKHLVTKAGMAVHMQNHYVEQLQNPAGIAELPALSDDAKNTTVDSTELFTFSDNLMNLVKRQDRDVEQKTYKCSICDKILASNGALINHTRLHTGSAQEFKCDECGKTFRTKGNMRTHSLIHTRGEDGSERQYACPICDKRYKNGSSLYSHSLMAHGAKTVLKRHNCIKCAEAFRFKSELETHMDTSHPDARPYICQLCEASFTTESKLQSHLKNSHREGSAVNGTICFDEMPPDTIPQLDLSILSSLLSCAKVEEDVKGNNKYCCPLCNKFLMSSKGLRIHLLTHTDAKKEFACKDCNKRFRTKYILKAHSLIHTRKYAGERQYACLLCHKKYKNRSSLYSHSLLEHAEAMTMKRHRCLVCSQTFRSKTALETHTETRHPGEKPYACTKCNATFQKDSTLRGHLKEVHMELCSLLLCNTCGKQFKRAGQLKDHERVHTGEKPFVCMLCGFKYHFSWELRNHEKRHVIGAADKLVCQVCGATFSSQWSHDTHVRRAHGNGTQRLRRTGERPLRWRWYDCPKCGERIGRSKEFCAHMGKHRLAEMRAARENRVPGPTKRRIRSEAQKIVERERNKLYRERKRARRLGLPKPPSPEGEPRAKRRNNGNGVNKRVRNRKRAVANSETTEDSNAKRLISVKVKDEVAMGEEMPNNFFELKDEHNGVSYNRPDGYAPARATMPTAVPYDRRQWNNSNSRSVARNIGQSTSLVRSEDNLPLQWQTWGNMPTHIMNSIYSQMSDTRVVGAGGDMSRNYNRNERQPQLANNSIYITGVHVNKAKSRHNFRTTRKFRRGLRARKMLRKYARLRGDSARARIVIDAVLGPHRILNYSYRHYWGRRPEKLTPPKNVFLPVPPLSAWQKNFL